MRNRVGHPVPSAVAEKAGVGDHQRFDLVGMGTRPSDADEAAPVVDDEDKRSKVLRGDELGERLEVVLEGGRG